MGLRVLSLFLLVLASAGATVLQAPKQVLLLSSYRSAVPASSALETGIRKGLDLPTHMPVDIDTDTSNLAMVHDKEYSHTAPTDADVSEPGVRASHPG